MLLPAYDSHRATRIGDQSRVRFLLGELAMASVLLAYLVAAVLL